MGKTNMPHGEDRIDGNGYVVYDDSYYSHNVQWESARLRQKEKVENWYSLISNKPTIEQYKAVGQYLINLGTAEQEKEKALMKAVLGTGFDYTDDELSKILFDSNLRFVRELSKPLCYKRCILAEKI